MCYESRHVTATEQAEEKVQYTFEILVWPVKRYKIEQITKREETVKDGSGTAMDTDDFC